MRAVGADFTRLWYLWDGTEGNDPERSRRMTEMQIEKLGGLEVPLRFVMGNHDLDGTRDLPPGTMPVLTTYDAFRQVPGWRSIETQLDYYFTEIHGEFLVLVLSDHHLSTENRWFATQQQINNEFPEEYPHGLEAYQALRRQIADWSGQVQIAGHYALCGGARGTPPGGPLERLLPLPDPVKLVLHGHSHLGDWRRGKAKTFHRISTSCMPGKAFGDGEAETGRTWNLHHISTRSG